MSFNEDQGQGPLSETNIPVYLPYEELVREQFVADCKKGRIVWLRPDDVYYIEIGNPAYCILKFVTADWYRKFVGGDSTTDPRFAEISELTSAKYQDLIARAYRNTEFGRQVINRLTSGYWATYPVLTFVRNDGSRELDAATTVPFVVYSDPMLRKGTYNVSTDRNIRVDQFMTSVTLDRPLALLPVLEQFQYMPGYHQDFWNNLSFIVPDFFEIDAQLTYKIYRDAPQTIGRYCVIQKVQYATPWIDDILPLVPSFYHINFHAMLASFNKVAIGFWPLKPAAAFGRETEFQPPMAEAWESENKDLSGTVPLWVSWRGLVAKIKEEFGSDFFGFNGSMEEEPYTIAAPSVPDPGQGHPDPTGSIKEKVIQWGRMVYEYNTERLQLRAAEVSIHFVGWKNNFATFASDDMSAEQGWRQMKKFALRLFEAKFLVLKAHKETCDIYFPLTVAMPSDFELNLPDPGVQDVVRDEWTFSVRDAVDIAWHETWLGCRDIVPMNINYIYMRSRCRAVLNRSYPQSSTTVALSDYLQSKKWYDDWCALGIQSDAQDHIKPYPPSFTGRSNGNFSGELIAWMNNTKGVHWFAQKFGGR